MVFLIIPNIQVIPETAYLFLPFIEVLSYLVFGRSRPAKLAFFKRNPQLYIKPLVTENNIKERKRERKKSSSGNQVNRKWISGEQGNRKGSQKSEIMVG